MSTKAEIKSVTTLDDLQKAYDGSYYFIGGAGGDLTEWVDGYNNLMAEQNVGKPVEWLQTTGAAINQFAGESVHPKDQFPLDLTCLLFPLDTLNVGVLAIFKIQMQDRWFDDVIQNMRRN